MHRVEMSKYNFNYNRALYEQHLDDRSLLVSIMNGRIVNWRNTKYLLTLNASKQKSFRAEPKSIRENLFNFVFPCPQGDHNLHAEMGEDIYDKLGDDIVDLVGKDNYLEYVCLVLVPAVRVIIFYKQNINIFRIFDSSTYKKNENILSKNFRLN